MTVALSEVAALVHRESGIRIAARQYPFLRAALDRMGVGAEPEAFLLRVSDPAQRRHLVARLIEEVTVKETSYLRDHAQLESIDWRRLLENARARGGDRVRVWTAPCATGEEAYSLAMLACEAFAPGSPPVSILATDISAGALASARRGVYGARSVRGLGAAMRARYFSEDAHGLVVGDRLRALVTLAQHNLVNDPFPPLGEAPFDLILCRNVLIYFDAETVAQVLASFERALARSGTLVLGAADVLCASASRLAAGPAAPAVRPASQPQRELRRPLGRLPVPALRGPEEVIATASRLIAEDPLDAGAHFLQGLAELENDDPAAAVNSLRRALYVDPHFGLAAFKLAGAHEALGDPAAARRAYEQALRTLEPHERHEPFLAQIDLADVAGAAQSRLDVLAATTR
ncbi:MAG: chemotaxis protein methyltransferase CheR [Solirubrobacteraceae bacterium]